MLWLAADQSEIWTTVFGAEAAYIRPADDEPLCARSSGLPSLMTTYTGRSKVCISPWLLDGQRVWGRRGPGLGVGQVRSGLTAGGGSHERTRLLEAKFGKIQGILLSRPPAAG